MRLLRPLSLTVAALLLSGANAPAPETALAEAEAKIVKTYAAAQEKLAKWCLEKKFEAEARQALQEVCLWDGRNAKAAKSLEGLPAEPAASPEEEKLKAELAALRKTLAKEPAAAFAKLALQAAKENSFAMARRLAARTRAIQAEADLAAVDKLLAAPKAVEALKALDADVEKAQGEFLLRPPGDGLMEYLLKLPKDYEAGKRIPLYIHIHGSGGNAMESSGDEGQRGAGYAFLAPTCLSSKGQGDAGAEANLVLRIVDRLCNDLGIDRDRVFLDGHSGGGSIAYTMIDKHRDRMRGVIPIEANFFVSIGRCAQPETFPVYVIKGEKDEHNEKILNREIAAALAALKNAQFVNVKFEIIPEMTHSTIQLCEPQILAWVQDILAFKQAPPAKPK